MGSDDGSFPVIGAYVDKYGIRLLQTGQTEQKENAEKQKQSHEFPFFIHFFVPLIDRLSVTGDNGSADDVTKRRNRVEKLALLLCPAFNDEIRAVHGTVAGLDLIALCQLLHGRHKLVLPAFPVHVDHQKNACAAFRNQLEKEKEDGHDDGNEQSELIVARAENDSDADGPEKEKHILRFLDGGTEADDGQRAHHTEGNDQIRLHRQDDACRYDGQNAEHDVELLVVKALFLRQIVDRVDVNAEQDCDAKRDADGSCGQRVVFHRFQNGVFDDILEAHLKNTFLFYLLY